MTRQTLLLVWMTALTGCTTTTHVVDRADAASIVAADAALRGQRARIGLASGERVTGRVEHVRADSVAWAGALRRAVPTSAVSSIVVDVRRREAGRGALGGAAVGTGLGLLLIVSNETEEFQYDTAVIAAAAASVVVVAAAVGAAGGAVRARRLEYVFAGGPSGPSE